MNKNTIIAVALSTVVVIGAFVFQSFTSPKKSKEVVVKAADESKDLKDTQLTADGKSSETAGTTENAADNTSEKKSENVKLTAASENAKAEDIIVETDKAKVTLTNKGGDIISFELKEHLENRKTNKGVEMADNCSSKNRAFAIALGGIDSSIINDYFEVVPEESDNPDLKIVKFRMKFNSENGPVTLEKKYTFNKNDYMFKLDVSFIGEDGKALSLDGYTLRSSPQIGPHYDSSNRYERREFISYSEKDRSKSISENDWKEYDEEYVWNGVAGKYFAGFVLPDVNTKSNMKYSWYSGKQNEENGNYTDAQAILVRKPVNSSSNQVTDTYYVYLGPRNEKELRIYNIAEDNPWGLSKVKFNSVISSGWLGWLETVLKWIMELIHMGIPNWGVAIILMTILLKLCLFPISRKQMLSSLKMQEIQPKMREIQENYKNNPQKQQELMGKLYRDAGYNPMSGCLPMIIQFLILFAMYNLFNNYFEFRGSEFIPGWIDDLSVGDSIVTFGFSIPLLGNTLRILPIIYLASQLFYGKITNIGAMSGTSSKQMKFMMYGMPIIFFFLFYNAPSGLLLYWTVSNIFQMGQQIVINKMKEKRVGNPDNKVVNAGKFHKNKK